MRRLFKNKSKFLAGICCLCLGVASLLAGAFSFVKAPAMAEEVADQYPGFYVEQGASIRYDDVVPGIRFAVYLTEAQWETFYAKGNYADDAKVEFKAEIYFANRLNKDGNTSNGYSVVNHTVTVKALNDYFEKAENVGKPFTIKPAILLSNAWKDAEGNETPKSPEELYRMYAEMEFYLTGAGIFVNESPIAVKTVEKDYTLRSVRSVAASLLAKGVVSDATQKEITEGFTKDANGEKAAEIVPVEIKAYYDKYANTGKVDVSAVEGLQVTDATKVTIGSTKVGDRALDGTELTLSRSAATLTDGKTYNVLVDNGAKIYAFKGLIAATEIFYQTNSKGENGVARLNERFALVYDGADANARRDTMLSMGKVETFVKDGVEYSMTFYDVDRGYYVLGEDIDFTGTWATRHSSENVISNNVAILHNDINDTLGYSGLFGFGGTFDGNGYSIKNLRFNRSITTVSGMFGALAYGAKIKDVAFVDAHPRDYDEGHRASYILAKATGSNITANPNGIAEQKTSIEVQKSNYAYLVAKYGSTECVVVDNCYFHVDHTMLKDSLATGGFTLAYPYNNPTDSIFQRHKFSSSSPAGQYAMGDFGVVYEGNSGYFKFSNCVLDIPEDEDTLGSYNNGGWGWIARSGYGNSFINTLSSLENCYQIADEASNGKILSGFRYHVISHKRDGDWKTETYVWDGSETRISTGYEVYAANDFADITDGTKLYSGLDADGKWVVVEATEDNGYTPQTTIYHYAGLNRFDNYVEMSANNKNSLAGFSSSWEKVDGAVIWKGLADATAEKTLDLTLSKKVGDAYEETTAIGVGDTIKVDAYYNGSNVTSSIALSTDNAEMLTIDGNTFTVAIGGEATLYVTAGAYTAEYTVVASAINNTAVTISSNYSKVQGKETAYSVPYVANGKDLVATDFLSLYQAYFSNNDATVYNVYLIDASGAKNTLAGVEDANGAIQYLFANAGNVKQALNIIIAGSEGYMSFADISSVTAVVTDTAGFNYIPSTAESRSGYYVLGNDYNNTKRADGKFTTRQDSILGNPIAGGSNQIGYSMGGFSEERYNAFMQNETTFNSNMKSNQRLQNMYNAFLGTFDGLGHTIDNMFIDSVGLLGGYRYETDGSTLKNVKLTNVRMAIQAQYTPYVDGVVSTTTNRATVFATLCYSGSASYKRLDESERINIENVVVELATTAHRNFGDNYGGTNGENLYWQMFRGVKHVVVNEDGTYKEDNNYNYVERSQRNVHLKDVVLTYKIGPRVGENALSNGGGVVFSYVNDSSANAALQSSYAFGAFENVYIVSAPAGNGKVAFVCSEYGSKTTFLGMAKNDFYSIFSEEYNANGNTGLYYYRLNLTDKGHVTSKSHALYNYEFDSTCVNNYLTDSKTYNITSGWGYITTTNEDGSTSTRWVYTNDVTTYGAAGSQYECASNEVFTGYENGIKNATCTVFYATPFERYNDYKAMSDAGKTQVGNFAISADGIVWSPAK